MTKISYQELRDGFIQWLRTKRLNERYVNCMVRYLDRFIDRPIASPMDIVGILSQITSGQQHNLTPGLHALLNFAELIDYSGTEILKKAIPPHQSGVDLNIPSESRIIGSLRMMEKADCIKHRAAYNLALDTGLRLTEVIKVIKSFEETEVQEADSFFMVSVGMFRRSKLAYYGFFSEHTLTLLRRLTRDDIASMGDKADKAASKYVEKKGDVIAYKYLRKFAFDNMIALDIPESVADFIEGRTPRSIGARHYMALLRQAQKFYPRYAEYLTTLRSKAGLA